MPRPRSSFVMTDCHFGDTDNSSHTKMPTSPPGQQKCHVYGLFIGNESDDTTKTAQAISFTTPPASLIFSLKKGGD